MFSPSFHWNSISYFQSFVWSKKINLIRFLQQVLSPSCAADYFMSKWKSFENRLILSIDNWVPHSVMLLYLHHRNSKLFFILQSLTTSKMTKFQTLKLSQFHKAKTCWTEIWWSSGIMSNFLGDFFYVLGVKKNVKTFLKIL